MALIGFRFNKMNVEKSKPITGKINIKNNIIITKVQEAKVNLGNSKQAGVEFSFEFNVDYEPDVAKILLDGAVVYMGSVEQVKDILDQWTKEKKMHKDIIEELYNHLLHKCNVQSLILARDMQLPAHIQLPKVSAK